MQRDTIGRTLDGARLVISLAWKVMGAKALTDASCTLDLVAAVLSIGIIRVDLDDIVSGNYPTGVIHDWCGGHTGVVKVRHCNSITFTTISFLLMKAWTPTIYFNPFVLTNVLFTRHRTITRWRRCRRGGGWWPLCDVFHYRLCTAVARDPVFPLPSAGPLVLPQVLLLPAVSV